MKTSETSNRRPLFALRHMTALYQSLPRFYDSEETSDVRCQTFTSTTPHGIKDILSTRSSSLMQLPRHATSTILQTKSNVTEPLICRRQATPVGLATVRSAISGTVPPSFYWAAAATSLMTPTVCWSQRGMKLEITRILYRSAA